MCEKYVITLGTAKTRFGYSEAQFFGFRVNKEGSHLALKHLDPIRNLVPPNDIHELRRVLGLFVVSRKYLANYALLSRPMTEILKGKPPTFRWGPEQQAAFDTIRDKLLEGRSSSSSAGLQPALPSSDRRIRRWQGRGIIPAPLHPDSPTISL